METATNAVVENHMSAMTSSPITQQKAITGQGLWDLFMSASNEQVTRMQQIELWANTGVTDAQIKEAFKTMVAKAKEIDKQHGHEKRGPKEQQAMNVRTIVQNSIGAIRLAKLELTNEGYESGKTGYIEMGKLAAAALKAKGIKWNGRALPTDASREADKAEAAKQLRADTFRLAMAELDQEKDEADEVYMLRVKKHAQALLEKRQVEENTRLISNLTDKLIKSLGRVDIVVIDQVYASFGSRIQAMKEAIASGALSADDATDTENEDENSGAIEADPATGTNG